MKRQWTPFQWGYWGQRGIWAARMTLNKWAAGALLIAAILAALYDYLSR